MNHKELIDKINQLKLNKEQYIEIYKILKNNNERKLMKNNNGIFVNLNDISENSINSIEKFIQYISTNDLSNNIITD
tara:strand:- start:2510 stop:2740 length:231 start_codon:yes stop_codon:yes gene_type:complete